MKYELTNETIVLATGKVLYRIKALKDFSDVKAGDIGGYIESIDNLSQAGNCWVYNNACVHDKACVMENAKVYGDAVIYENAKVYGDAVIEDDACVCGSSEVFDTAEVYDKALLYDNVRLGGNAKVGGHAVIYDVYLKGGFIMTKGVFKNRKQ